MPGNEEMQREHSKLFGTIMSDLQSAHRRIDNLDEFLKEFREMVKSMLEMNGNVKLLAQEMKTISETLVTHEDAIEVIQGKMETKERVDDIFADQKKMKEELVTKNELSVVVKEQHNIKLRLAKEENKEAQRALNTIERVKWWFVGGAGAVIAAIVMLYLGLR